MEIKIKELNRITSLEKSISKVPKKIVNITKAQLPKNI